MNKILEFGLTTEEYESLIKRKVLNDDSLYKSIINKYELLKSYITKKEYIELLSKNPKVLIYTNENIKSKITYFQSLGFSNKDLSAIIKHFSFALTLTIENINSKIEGIKALGFTKEETIKILKKSSRLIAFSMSVILSRIDYYKSLGIEDKSIKAALKECGIIFSYSNKYIDDKIAFFNFLGFNEYKLKKMLNSWPQLLTISNKNTILTLESIKKNNFTYNETLYIGFKHPQIFGYKIESINKRIKELYDFGLNQTEVKNFIINYPGILSISKESLQEKFTIYKNIGLFEIIKKYPKNIIQSASLTYARFKFYESINLHINEANFRKMFLGEKNFISQYNLTNADILSRYLDNQEKVMIKNE